MAWATNTRGASDSDVSTATGRSTITRLVSEVYTPTFVATNALQELQTKFFTDIIIAIVNGSCGSCIVNTSAGTVNTFEGTANRTVGAIAANTS